MTRVCAYTIPNSSGTDRAHARPIWPSIWTRRRRRVVRPTYGALDPKTRVDERRSPFAPCRLVTVRYRVCTSQFRADPTRSRITCVYTGCAGGISTRWFFRRHVCARLDAGIRPRTPVSHDDRNIGSFHTVSTTAWSFSHFRRLGSRVQIVRTSRRRPERSVTRDRNTFLAT